MKREPKTAVWIETPLRVRRTCEFGGVRDLGIAGPAFAAGAAAQTKEKARSDMADKIFFMAE